MINGVWKREAVKFEYQFWNFHITSLCFTEEITSYWFGVNEGVFVFRWIIPLSIQKICELLLFKGQSLLKITDRSSFLWNVLGDVLMVNVWYACEDLVMLVCWSALPLRISVLCLCSSKHWLKAPVVQPVLWWVLCFKKCKWLLKLKNRHDYVSIWWEQDVTHEVSLWDSDRECNGGVLVMGQQLMVTLLFKSTVQAPCITFPTQSMQH